MKFTPPYLRSSHLKKLAESSGSAQQLQKQRRFKGKLLRDSLSTDYVWHPSYTAFICYIIMKLWSSFRLSYIQKNTVTHSIFFISLCKLGYMFSAQLQTLRYLHTRVNFCIINAYSHTTYFYTVDSRLTDGGLSELRIIIQKTDWCLQCQKINFMWNLFLKRNK
jgi:hypothetical protein